MVKSKKQDSASLYSIDLAMPESVADFVDAIWRRRIHYKYQIEREWFLNIAWFIGEQNVVWNRATHCLDSTPAPPWRVRLIINKIKPALRTMLSKILKYDIDWDVQPATTDAEDIAIADLNKNILNYRWAQGEMFDKMLEAFVYLAITGNGILKPYWDPDAGEPISATAEDMIEDIGLSDSERKKLIKQIEKDYEKELGSLYAGDTCLKAVSPFSIIADPQAKNMETAVWVIESGIDSVEAVKEKYGKAADHITNDEGASLGEGQVNYEQKLRRLHSSSNTYGDSLDVNSCIVHELWIKPQSRGKFKDGFYAIVCQGKVLNNKGKGTPFPYKHRRLPYVHFREVVVPGQFWGTSTCRDLMPIQAEYNRNRSQIIENRNLMGRPKWLSPKSAGILGTAITSEPGEVIEYNFGSKPEMVPPPTLPAWIQNINQDYIADFEDISGQHEASRAKAPGEIRGVQGVVALIQQDESRLGPLIMSNDKNFEKLGGMLLSIDHQYVTEERLAQYTDTENELIAFQFSGGKMVGRNRGYPGIDYFKVRVRTIPGMPHTRLAQQEFLTNLVDRKILDPVEDKKLILNLIGIGNAEKFADTYRQHRGKAIQENNLMAQGEITEVKTYQDHDVHIDVHNQFRNRPEFEKLPKQIQDIFEAHVTMHKEAWSLLQAEKQVMLQKATMTLAQIHGLVPQGAPTGGTPADAQPQEVQ